MTRPTRTKNFLVSHPTCCFCDGTEPATTVDHIPPRSFFLDKKHPTGLEFPACEACNITTSDTEDIARSLCLLHGTVSNNEVLKDFMNREESYIRTMRERRIAFNLIEEAADGTALLRIDDDSRDALVQFARKVALALYYRITKGVVLKRQQRVALTFYTAQRMHLMYDKFWFWSERPMESSLSDPDLAKQFFYIFHDQKKSGFKADEGSQYSALFHFHKSYLWLAIYLDSESYVKDIHKIVVAPFDRLRT